MWAIRYVDNRTFVIIGGPIIVGRKLDCQVYFPDDRSVSRKHCEFHLENEALYCLDQESTYGTYCNGVKLAKNTLVEIKENVTIKFGNENSVITIMKLNIKVCPTRLSKVEKDEMMKVIQKRKFECVKTVPECTHIVCNKFTATLKTVEAIVLKKEIVLLEWLLAFSGSSDAKLIAYPDPAQYFPPGGEVVGVINIKQSRNELLNDYLILLLTQNDVTLYQKVLESCGAACMLFLSDELPDFIKLKATLVKARVCCVFFDETQGLTKKSILFASKLRVDFLGSSEFATSVFKNSLPNLLTRETLSQKANQQSQASLSQMDISMPQLNLDIPDDIFSNKAVKPAVENVRTATPVKLKQSDPPKDVENRKRLATPLKPSEEAKQEMEISSASKRTKTLLINDESLQKLLMDNENELKSKNVEEVKIPSIFSSKVANEKKNVNKTVPGTLTSNNNSGAIVKPAEPVKTSNKVSNPVSLFQIVPDLTSSLKANDPNDNKSVITSILSSKQEEDDWETPSLSKHVNNNSSPLPLHTNRLNGRLLKNNSQNSLSQSMSQSAAPMLKEVDFPITVQVNNINNKSQNSASPSKPHASDSWMDNLRKSKAVHPDYSAPSNKMSIEAENEHKEELEPVKAVVIVQRLVLPPRKVKEQAIVGGQRSSNDKRVFKKNFVRHSNIIINKNDLIVVLPKESEREIKLRQEAELENIREQEKDELLNDRERKGSRNTKRSIFAM